jgi:hypothetical protein
VVLAASIIALMMEAVRNSETSINSYLPAYTAQHPRKQQSSYLKDKLSLHLSTRR